MKTSKTRARFTCIATLLAAQPLWAAEPILIEDESAFPNDWDRELLFENATVELLNINPEGPPSGGVGTHPDPFLELLPTVAGRDCPPDPCAENPGSKVHWGFIYSEESYDPSESGRISDLEISVYVNALRPPVDAQGFNQDHTTNLGVYLAARQDGVTYWRSGQGAALAQVGYDGAESGWQHAEAMIDLDDAQFSHWEENQSDPTPTGPNFVNGGPIEFGLLVSLGTAIEAHEFSLHNHGYMLTWPLGVDSFQVTVHRNDVDGDGHDDDEDNCTAIENPTQCDTDEDGYGNHCDGDFDQNWSTNTNDFTNHWVPDFQINTDTGSGTDMDCNGAVNTNDYTQRWVPNFQAGEPGPSGLSCAGTVPCDL